MLPPPPVEGGEDPERLAGGGGDVARRDRVGRVDHGQAAAVGGEGLLHGRIPAGAVGREVPGDEDLLGLDLPGDGRHLLHRVAGAEDEVAPGALVELGQAAGQEGQPGPARGPLQLRVVDEQGHHLVGRVEGGQEGGVVGQAQVAPEPQSLMVVLSGRPLPLGGRGSWTG